MWRRSYPIGLVVVAGVIVGVVAWVSEPDRARLVALDPRSGDRRWATEVDGGRVLSMWQDGQSVVVDLCRGQDRLQDVVDLATGRKVQIPDAEPIRQAKPGAVASFSFGTTGFGESYGPATVEGLSFDADHRRVESRAGWSTAFDPGEDGSGIVALLTSGVLVLVEDNGACAREYR